MKIRPVVIAAALLALAADPASAGPFSAIYAFGDSLSDAGNGPAGPALRACEWLRGVQQRAGLGTGSG